MIAPSLSRALPDVTVGAQEQELADTLYRTLHCGQSGTARKALKRDRSLEQALAAVVPHETTEVQVELRRSDAQRLLVEWEGVLVWVPASSVVDTTGESARLRVPPVRPGLSPGFLLADSSRPFSFTGSLLRVYVHVTEARHAPAVWYSVLTHLEEHGVAYRAKALSRADEYPRRDAIVVYLPPESADADRLITRAVADTPGIGADTSVFAERLASGVARAWEPVDTRLGLSGLSFGQHRARILARALIHSLATGEPRETAVARAFTDACIDPGNPALNLVP